jgi:TatD DNase family protein
LGEIPLERILLETDAPYLTPVPHRGKRNEPSYLVYIAEKISQIYGKTTEEIKNITTENAKRLFF